jgi:predicted membrane protein
VRQPDNVDAGFAFGRPRYRWDVRLGEMAALDLDVQLGAGRNTLTLTGLDITHLNVETGAGRSTIDLRGDWSRSFDAQIHTGAGKVVVILPAETGVRVEAAAGIGRVTTEGLTRQDGSWVNDAFGATDVTLNLVVEAGSGEIELRVGS